MPVQHKVASARFNLLVHALAERIGAPVNGTGGAVVLADDTGKERLVLELLAGDYQVRAMVPFLDFPDQAAMGRLALWLLKLNGDREALQGATLAADMVGRRFCAIQSLDLALEPEAFVAAVGALMMLADRVRRHVTSRGRGFDPERAMAAFLQG